MIHTDTVAATLLALALSASAWAAPIVLFQTVTNFNDSGAASLRAAITNANGDQPNPTEIRFDIAGPAPFTIQPLTPLPEVAATVFIRGDSQRGFSGTPVIELDGSMAGPAADGLVLRGPGSQVHSLAINGWTGNGVLIDGADGSADGVRVQGCFIGTDVTGTLARPNQGTAGVSVQNAVDLVIGGSASGEGNLISGNTVSGVRISGLGARSNRVVGNLIGTDVSGNAPLPNGLAGAGVVITLASRENEVGGAQPGEGNVIAANGGGGVLIALTGRQRVLGNFIGVGADGVTPMGNSAGVVILFAVSNEIGIPGAGNVVAASASAGIAILGSSTLLVSQGNRVRGNRIGTDASGLVAMPNVGDGVLLMGAANNRVGGAASDEGNLISGNGANGILIMDPASGGNSVEGNLIGTDASGTFAIGNTDYGIHVMNSPGNLIGGPVPGARNVISGNGTSVNEGGIYIQGASATANLIQGNFIGTDVIGTAAIRNINGVHIFGADDCIIGGPATGEGNLISGNSLSGVQLSGADATTVQGNLIGTDVTGCVALGNRVGVSLGMASNSLVGGGVPSMGNVISGNLEDGIQSLGATSADNMIAGNLIGVAADGVTPLGNGVHGIDLGGVPINNIVGGARFNTIAHNASAGIVIRAGSGNQIAVNSIHSNGALGIDLGADGVTPNDPLDGDGGPNGLTNFPTIVSAEIIGDTLGVVGEISGAPNTSYVIQHFVSALPDPSGFGEGVRFAGGVSVITDASGMASYEYADPIPPDSGRHVTAAATGPDGTSEFSAAFAAEGAGPLVGDIVAFLLGLIPDPGDLDLNMDLIVDSADVVTRVNASPEEIP